MASHALLRYAGGGGEELGSIRVDGAAVQFEGWAESVFAAYRRRLGDQAAAELLMAGWSNGYLYLDLVTGVIESAP